MAYRLRRPDCRLGLVSARSRPSELAVSRRAAHFQRKEPGSFRHGVTRMDAPVATAESQNRNDHTRSSDRRSTLGADELRRINAYWRAANYLSVGQIYLYDNPLLKEPLKLSHVKPLVVG